MDEPVELPEELESELFELSEELESELFELPESELFEDDSVDALPLFFDEP